MNLKFLNNVIFPEWIEKYDDEVISNIKHAAQTHGRYLERYDNQHYLINRSIELSKSTKYQSLNPTQKLIFISNVIFNNDEEFIYKMSNYGWTKEKNKNLNDLIIRIKVLQRMNHEINLDTSLLDEINYISINCFGIDNPVILINRLNEVTITKRESLQHINYTKKILGR